MNVDVSFEGFYFHYYGWLPSTLALCLVVEKVCLFESPRSKLLLFDFLLLFMLPNGGNDYLFIFILGAFEVQPFKLS